MEPKALSRDALDALPEAVGRPGYARQDLSRGILHFGPGNFHRAHQAMYLDRLFTSGRDHDWALVAASVMAPDATPRTHLLEQDGLYTLVEQSAERDEARVIGSIIDYLPIADRDALLETLADPAIRIVSLTVTEGGYYLDASGHVRTDAEPLVADGDRPHAPETVFGLIAAGLVRRREAGTPPFTVMSCDNLPHNGHVAREAVEAVAGRWDGALREWIAANVSFPCGMVDRITPATGERERRRIVEEFGVGDTMPVFAEDFVQWVLEDDFPAGRPALEAVGVQFVEDVTPYESMKIRILNGGHAIIAYPAGLLDIEFVHEAMADGQIRGFLDRVEHREVLPHVPELEGIEHEDYLATVIERFANPKIGDTIRRLCLDGSNRQPKFIVPSIADGLAGGLDCKGLALESALWCRYCFGTTESGRRIEPNDPDWSHRQEVARRAKDDPGVWLDMHDVYGETGRDAGFRQRFAEALDGLHERGVRAMLDRYLAGH